MTNLKEKPKKKLKLYIAIGPSIDSFSKQLAYDTSFAYVSREYLEKMNFAVNGIHEIEIEVDDE